jgi:DNA-binding transcriptional LysR family regulator
VPSNSNRAVGSAGAPRKPGKLRPESKSGTPIAASICARNDRRNDGRSCSTRDPRRNPPLLGRSPRGTTDVVTAPDRQTASTIVACWLGVASMPMLWLASGKFARPAASEPLPLVLYDHPCLFRQAALQTLERKGLRWRILLTTPSLPGVWAALRATQGVSVRTSHRVPAGVRDVGVKFGLPKLPLIELRMLTMNELSPAASDFRDILAQVVRRRAG